MGRWRPPQARGSNYITRAGADRLQAELKQLWKVERPQVTEVVHQAALNGDRSENGDYIYGKRRLAEIDRRVRYLNQRLEEVTIVEDRPKDQSKVYFAACVTVASDDGKEQVYQIVGPDEFDLKHNKISMDSPLARALLGRSLNDQLEWQANGTKQTLTIINIIY